MGVLFFWGCTGKTFIPVPEGGGGVVSAGAIAKYCANEFFGTLLFTLCLLTLSNKNISTANKSYQMYVSIPIAYFLVRL